MQTEDGLKTEGEECNIIIPFTGIPARSLAAKIILAAANNGQAAAKFYFIYYPSAPRVA